MRVVTALVLGLAFCPVSLPSSKSTPDGKRWTLANMNAEIPGSFCYDDQPANCERYGRLYTWEAAHKACAMLGTDWRLPAMSDWRALAQPYGGLFGDGPDSGKTAYRELLVGGRSGLEMLLGGGRGKQGYARLEAHGFYWSASEESPTTARLLNFGKGSRTVYDQDADQKTHAYAVRCVSDSAPKAFHLSTPLVVPTGQAPWLTHDAGRFRILVSNASTNGSYSLLELVELPGYKTPPHRHPDMDETFYVLEGTLELRLAGKTHLLAAGSYAHIPRNTPHAQGSADGKLVRLLVTLSPGEFEEFFVDRADLAAKIPREHPDFQRLYMEIIRKHSRWLQPATLEPATTGSR